MEESALEHEQTLCQIPNVHVFKIPPRATAGGHRATDWNVRLMTN